jgi:hypothetical protein
MLENIFERPKHTLYIIGITNIIMSDFKNYITHQTFIVSAKTININFMPSFYTHNSLLSLKVDQCFYSSFFVTLFVLHLLPQLIYDTIILYIGI